MKESDIQTSYIKLTWTSPVDNGGNPVLEYRVIVSGVANQTLEGVVCKEKLIEKLTPGKSYTVTVSARNSVGYGESDSRSFASKSEGNVKFFIKVAFPILHFHKGLLRPTCYLSILVLNLVGKAKQESSRMSYEAKDAIYGSILAISVIFNLLKLFYIIWMSRKMAG